MSSQPDGKKTAAAIDAAVPADRAKTVSTRACGIADEGRFEAIHHEARPRFLVYTSAGRFELHDVVTVAGKKYAPPTECDIPYLPYGLHESPVPSKAALYALAKHESEKYLDIEPVQHVILAATILLSYKQHLAETLNILHVFGDNETGKTVALTLINALAYRPLFSVCSNAADLYGYLQDHDEGCGTILEDEIDGLEKDRDKLKVYKSGYRPHGKVARYRDTENGQQLRFYNTYSLKVVAGERLFTDKGLNQRVVPLQMFEGEPPAEWIDTRVERDQIHTALRNQLLRWRLATYEEPLPALDDLPFKARVKELYKALLQILHGLPDYEVLFAYIDQALRERLDELRNTLEGHIVQLLWDKLADASAPAIPVNDVWQMLLEDLKGVEDPWKPYVMLTSDFDEVTKTKVGYRLREVLGGRRAVRRSKESKLERVWTFTPGKLRKAAKKYGCDMAVTKLPTVPIPPDEAPPPAGQNQAEKGENRSKQAGRNSLLEPSLGNIGNTVTGQEEPKT